MTPRHSNRIAPRLPPERLRCQLPGVWHSVWKAAWRFAFFFTIRYRTAGLDHIPQRGGCILAVNHASHLDPVILSTLLARPVSWLARVEFYRRALTAWFMRMVGAIPVERGGYVVPAIREALRRLASGQVVGIFPEGEITTGEESVARGGLLKGGAALLALRSGCPIVPVLLAGSEKLMHPGPWMPALRGRLWLLVGEPIFPTTKATNRMARAELTQELAEHFPKLHAELCRRWDLPESILP